MNKNKYITTTLPYANSRPHIGHAFEFIIGDALSRYFKLAGDNVFFNIGLDEHGLKIQEAAEASGITPKEYVDKFYKEWLDFVHALRVASFDNFYRTSERQHYVKVQCFWIDALNRGDIYKKKYTGTYCVGCESFKLEKDLIHFPGDLDNLKCEDHPNLDVQFVEEENYFFRLSNYKLQLQIWAAHAVNFIEPTSKRVEFLNFIDNIQDISVSRIKEKVSWGISVPEDDGQTIYVWFDALLNYIFAAGYLSEDFSVFDKLWNDSDVIQICGPDNLKFQAVIFQGLLASTSIKNSDKLLVHGTILDAQGRKMSKTLGNVIDPIDQINKFGVDAVRYYALAGLSTYGNSSWDEKRLVELYNSHLADDYGNLVARVTHLAGKFLDEHKDNPNIVIDYSLVEDDKWCVFFNLHLKDVIRPLWENYKISEALDETNKVVKSLNKKFGDEEPWKKISGGGWTTILEIHYALNKINDLYYPVIPDKVGPIRIALRECKKAIIFPKLELKITA